MEEVLKIAGFIIRSFAHIWPYLLITIPLAVAIKVTGISKYINKAFNRNILLSILLATVVGAFSPLCSCGVIPVISSLLISGVPLAPVMSFWIASPSMDPEIFLLSTGTLGWEISVWRLAGTFVLSLSSGLLTYLAVHYGWIEKDFLRVGQTAGVKSTLRTLRTLFMKVFKSVTPIGKTSPDAVVRMYSIDTLGNTNTVDCCTEVTRPHFSENVTEDPANGGCGCTCSCDLQDTPLRKKIFNETWKASLLVAKFMTLAFFINALIHFYVPNDLISRLLGGKGTFSVFISAVIGIPVYTSNLLALPLIGDLIDLGMNKGAALAFLIAGPTTTLPAMSAVWGLVKWRVFLMYVSFAFAGAILIGLLYNLFY